MIDRILSERKRKQTMEFSLKIYSQINFICSESQGKYIRFIASMVENENLNKRHIMTFIILYISLTCLTKIDYIKIRNRKM